MAASPGNCTHACGSKATRTCPHGPCCAACALDACSGAAALRASIGKVDHCCDADCEAAGFVDETGCQLCGVGDGDPCPNCGGVRFHEDGCATPDR